MKIKISKISYYLPKSVENVEVLQSDNPDWEMSKILEKTGIFTRRIAGANETAVDLAFKAASSLFDTPVNREEIDLLVLVTQSPDYVLPTSACVLQGRLGLPKACMSFDVNLGCSGFVYALGIVSSLIDAGIAHNGLIVCADTYTKYIGKNDRTCRPIFSDGAAAILITQSGESSIGPFVFGTDGSGYDKLIVKNSGARSSEDESNTKSLEMQGSDVFMFTMREVPAVVNKLLDDAHLSISDIDLFVFHQASKLVIDNLVRHLSLDESKVFRNYGTIGNTVSASIPIALKDASDQGVLQKGDRVMLIGFGVGLSWGATLLRW